MKAYIHGKRIKLNPRHAIGKGGEADICDIGKGKALKLFKSPIHPNYQGLPHGLYVVNSQEIYPLQIT